MQYFLSDVQHHWRDCKQEIWWHKQRRVAEIKDLAQSMRTWVCQRHTTTPTRPCTTHQEGPISRFCPFRPAHKLELLEPLLAFWKCHTIYPEAFQPVKLKQGCKAETLMKCINLEHRAFILITVWFVYEPSQEQRKNQEDAEGGNGPYTHTYI